MTALTQTLTRPDSFAGVIGTFMGRDALTLVAQHLALSSDDTVLLPAYSCKEVLRPFLKRARVEFYDVRPDLAIDPDGIKARLKAGKIKAALIINYFGFLQPCRAQIKRICAEQEVALIEDAAHSLLTEGSGKIGDFVIYSFRKSLPVPDGGGLRINRGEQPIRSLFYPTVVSNALSLLITAKSKLHVRSQVFSRAGLTTGNGDLSAASVTLAKEARLLPMSSFARTGIGREKLDEIVDHKRRDFEFWMQACQGSSAVRPLFESLPAGVCPLGFPVLASDRDAFVAAAKNSGLDLMVHWRLPAGLGSECTTSHSISRQTMTLPIYPDLSLKHRAALQELIRRA